MITLSANKLYYLRNISAEMSFIFLLPDFLFLKKSRVNPGLSVDAYESKLSKRLCVNKIY